MTGGALELMDAEGTDLVEIELGELIAALAIDRGGPTAEEAAAIAATIGAHLADREDTAPEAADPWSLAGRVERNGHGRLPRTRTVPRGREWQAVARTG